MAANGGLIILIFCYSRHLFLCHDKYNIATTFLTLLEHLYRMKLAKRIMVLLAEQLQCPMKHSRKTNASF